MQYQFDREEEEIVRERIEEVAAMSHDLFGEKNVIVWRETPAIKTAETKFDFFAISNALARRDRRQLWLGYQRALAASVEPETVFWRALWWKVRQLRDKALAGQLVALWHDTKREENRNFALELESLLLRV